MQLPVQISFRNMDKSEAVEEIIRVHAARLEKHSRDLLRCDVMVERPHHNHRRGNVFHVRIRLTLPGGEIAVGRDPERNHAHEDLPVAVRDAFRAARRELMDLVRAQRGQTKAHAEPARARVARLVLDEVPGSRYGFLETRDGRTIYFHERSVLDGFERLAPGTMVRFAEENGDAGPQASTVAIVRRPARGAAAVP
jgi:cold shock CspA family protein/ribosome-associated translation inhibitor RaiA